MLSLFQFCITYQGKWFLSIIIFSSTLQMAIMLHQVLLPQNKMFMNWSKSREGCQCLKALEHGIYMETWRNCTCLTAEMASSGLAAPVRPWSRERWGFTGGKERAVRNHQCKLRYRKFWTEMKWVQITGNKYAVERLLQGLGNFAHFQDSTTQSP